jgi:ankyrin repeat protein
VRGHTALRTEVGTHGFLAPEVVIEGCDEYTNKVDLWSLGCVVFNALAHTIPFPTLGSLALFCSEGAFPMEPLVAKKVTPEGVSFLKTLLVADPRDRLTAEAALDAEWLATSKYSFQPKMMGPQEAQPLRLRDNKKQINSPATLDHGIVSKHAIQEEQVVQLIQDAPAIRLLRLNGFELYKKKFEVNAALMWAASNDHEGDVIRFLFRRGADIRSKSGDGWTALQLAAESGHETVVRLLLEKWQDINAKNIYGQTALHRAAEYGHETVVRLLLEKWADVAVKDCYGWSALHRAAFYGHKTVVQLLLEEGADINAKVNGWTALHMAANYGSEAVVQVLVENGADIAAKDVNGQTALHIAASWGHEAVVRLLLEKTDDVMAKDNYGYTALLQAEKNGHQAVVRLLWDPKA